MQFITYIDVQINSRLFYRLILLLLTTSLEDLTIETHPYSINYDHEFQGTDLNETVFILRNHFGHEELSFRNMQRSGTKLFKTFRDQHMKRHT